MESDNRLPVSGSLFSRLVAQVSAFRRRHFHKERGGRAKLGMVTSVATRVILTVSGLLMVPISIGYLKNEGYGLLTVISSVVGWLQFSNLGIGQALQNALTEAVAKGDEDAQNELVSTAFFTLCGIGLLLGVLGALAFGFVDWPRVFPTTTDRFVHELPVAVAITFCGFVSSLALSFLWSIYAARQEIHLGNIQSLCAGILSLAGVIVAVKLRAGLTGVLLGSVGMTALVQWAFAAWTLFGRKLPALRPRWRAVSIRVSRCLFRKGMAFLIIQISCIAVLQADAFLIAHFVSTEQVTPYSVAQRVFLQVGGLVTMMCASLWAAYGNAKALGDIPWIRRIHRKAIQMLFLISGGTLVLMTLVGEPLLGWWVGQDAAPGRLLIVVVGLHFFMMQWVTIHGTVLNGLDVIRPQTIAIAIHAFVVLALNLWLVQIAGPLGIALGGLLSYCAVSGWYFPCLVRKELLKRSPATAARA